MAKGGGVHLDQPTIAAILVAFLWVSSAILGLPPIGSRASRTEGGCSDRKGAALSDYTLRALWFWRKGLLRAEIQGQPLETELLKHTRVTKENIAPPIPRKGWKDSPLHQALTEYDDKEFRKRFRLNRRIFNKLVDRLVETGYLRDNKCQNPKFRTPAWFKAGVAVLHLAQGGTLVANRILCWSLRGCGSRVGNADMQRNR